MKETLPILKPITILGVEFTLPKGFKFVRNPRFDVYSKFVPRITEAMIDELVRLDWHGVQLWNRQELIRIFPTTIPSVDPYSVNYWFETDGRGGFGWARTIETARNSMKERWHPLIEKQHERSWPMDR